MNNKLENIESIKKQIFKTVKTFPLTINVERITKSHGITSMVMLTCDHLGNIRKTEWITGGFGNADWPLVKVDDENRYWFLWGTEKPMGDFGEEEMLLFNLPFIDILIKESIQ